MRPAGNEESIPDHATEAAAEPWRFLAEAGSALASSLDFLETLETAARLAVRLPAEYAFLDLLEDECLGHLPAGTPSSWLHRLTGKHRDAAQQPLVADACRFVPPRSSASHPIVRAIEGGRPVSVELCAETLSSIVRSEEHGRLAAALGGTFLLCVPLIARGRTLGALVCVGLGGELLRPESGDLAAALADRVALALDNALVYERARTATRLRDEWIATVSHDLRNPLNVMTMVVDALRRDLQDPGDRMQRRFDAMQRSSDRMTRLIDELLDATKREAGSGAALALGSSPDEGQRSPR